MKKLTHIMLVIAFIASGLFVMPANAQESIAIMYTMTPKADARAEFETAFAEHIAWRQENNDPWTWTTYTPVVGEDLATFYVRTDGHTWADWDAYGEFQANAVQHFQQTVSPHMKEIHSQVDVPMAEFTRWRESDDGPSNYVSVTTFDLKPGGEMAFTQALGKIVDAIKQEDYPLYFGFFQTISGLNATTITVANGQPNMAGFQDPDTEIGEVLGKVYGQDGAMEIYNQFFGSLNGERRAVLVRRADLSTN